MTPDLYERLWTVFEEVAALPPANRHAALDARCAGDSALRAEVEQLLDQTRTGAGAFLHDPCPLAAVWRGGGSLVGRRIGAYEIRRRLGAGGMGEVYLAERTEDFAQRVAVKVINSDRPTDDLCRRFQDERRVLAGLRHPNIARLLDGGTLDGRPYLVMEYIEGERLDEFCRNRNLPRAARLRLFLQVCGAVQFAHQNLVLHRDLKPGNILVDATGAPKLIDFGIAKVLTADGAGDPVTRHPFATPEYASPEQLRGEIQPTTGTDIYALGVILYELLTDVRPFTGRDRSPLELARAVCEEEPVSPRLKRPDVPRDLAVVCLKCLRKGPADRFASVAELADEVHRVLVGRPIRSRPVGVGERLRLWAWRRPVEASLAVLLGVTAVTLLAFVSWDNHRLQAARRTSDEHRVVAERNEALLAGVLDELLAILGDDGLYAGPDVTAQQVATLERLVGSVRDQMGHEDSSPRLQRLVGQILHKLGQLHYLLGDDEKGLGCYEQAIALQRPLAAGHSDEPLYRHDLADTLHSAALALRRVNRSGESAEYGREAVALHEGLVRHDPHPRYREALAREYHHLGNLRKSADDFAGARDYFRRGRDLLDELARQHPDEPRYARSLAVNLHSWGHTLAGRPDPASQDEARANYARAEDILHRLTADHPGAADYPHELARLCDSMAALAAAQGQVGQAEAHYEKAIRLQTRLVTDRPAIVKYRYELARHFTHLGDLYRKSDPAEAKRAYDHALEQQRRLVSLLPRRAVHHGDLGVLLVKRARCEANDSAQLPPLLREAVTELDMALNESPANKTYQTHREEAVRSSAPASPR